MLILVAEPGPKEDGKRGEEDEWRVEKDVSGLGDKGVLEYDEERGEERCSGAAIKTPESQVRERDRSDPEGRRDKAHGDVRRVFV